MELALYLARGTLFAAVAAFGGFCWAGALSGTRIDDRTRWLLRRMAASAAVLGLVSGVILFLTHACQMLDKPILNLDSGDLWLVGAETRFGRTHLSATVFLLLACAAFLTGKAPRLTVLFCGVSIVGGLLASHAVAAGGGIPAIANIVHVMAAALWFGALPPLAVIQYRRRRCDQSNFALVLRGFSRIALPLMIAIVATGVILAVDDVATWPGLLATGYGRLLLLKIACVATVLLCAAVIRKRFLPELAAGRVRPALSAALGIELVFACLVALLAGSLSQTTPSKHDDIVWPLSFRFDPSVAWRTVQGAELRVYLGGIVVIVAGGLSFLLGRSGRWRLAAIGAVTGFGAGAAIALPSLTIPAYPTTYATPQVAYDTAAIARGLQVFSQNCADCHGVGGRGNGPAAANLKPTPADLTAPHTGDHTMGDMFWWVSHGYPSSAMPGFADTLSDSDRWRVVEYVMALSLGHQGRVLDNRISARQPWLHAIDFPICGRGEAPPRLVDRLPERSKILVFINDRADEGRLTRLAQEAAAFSQVGGLVIAVFPRALRGILERSYTALGVCTIVDDDGVITTAWNLYRRSFANPGFDGLDTSLAPIEYLVDRFGFVRARWRADEAEGLAESEELVEAFRQLQAEPEINRRGVHDH